MTDEKRPEPPLEDGGERQREARRPVAPSRQEMLAEKMRENLRRRKQQSRARSDRDG